MKNNYIKAYLNIINEFNENNFVHYKPYKKVEIYINRTHVLQRQNECYKYLTDLNYIV